MERRDVCEHRRAAKRTRVGRLAATVLLCALSASAAQADWQYTRWGMAKDQVMLASNGALSPTPSRRASNPYVGLRGRYQTDDHSFDAAMLFDAADTLAGVMLSQRTSRDCMRTLNDLRGKYGAAQELNTSREPLKLMWSDAKNGNRIKYNETPRLDARGAADAQDVACTLIYEPLSKTADGL